MATNTVCKENPCSSSHLCQVSEQLRPHHPKRLRSLPRPVLSLARRWRNKVAVPSTFSPDEQKRLVELAVASKGHGWEEIARKLGGGHSAIQCLRAYQRWGGRGGRERGAQGDGDEETEEGARVDAAAGGGRRGGGGGAAVSGNPSSLPHALVPSNLINRGPWTAEEDERLGTGVALYADNWTLVAEHVGTRSASQCRHRQNSRELNKEAFSREEQKRLILATKAYASEVWREVKEGRQKLTGGSLKAEVGVGGGGWWRSVANHLPGRSDVQCRSRWYQTLHPHTNRGDWSEEEVGRLRALVETHGPNWVKIAGEMGSGRTRQQVKQMHSRLVREDTRREKAREKEKEAERVRKEQREGRGRVAQGKGGGGRRGQEPEPDDARGKGREGVGRKRKSTSSEGKGRVKSVARGGKGEGRGRGRGRKADDEIQGVAMEEEEEEEEEGGRALRRAARLVGNRKGGRGGKKAIEAMDHFSSEDES